MRPIIFLSSPREQCLTFFWRELPGVYAGYRFLEDRPHVLSAPAGDYRQAPLAHDFPPLPNRNQPPLDLPPNDPLFRSWMIRYESDTLSFQSYADGLAGCWVEESDYGLREMFFEPEENGVRMWLRFTASQDIPEGLAVQQCLRFTGRMNDPWRVQIAHFPLLSELDMQAMGRPNATLTWARKDGQWFNFPVPYTALPTRPGQPYLPGSLALDHGLILRESPAKSAAPPSYWNRAAAGLPWEQASAGMYWERTAYVSNRHPADCLHAWLDLGPLEAGQEVILRGMFYLIEGSKDNLLKIFETDFRQQYS